jgi:hypothetical protein
VHYRNRRVVPSLPVDTPSCHLICPFPEYQASIAHSEAPEKSTHRCDENVLCDLLAVFQLRSCLLDGPRAHGTSRTAMPREHSVVPKIVPTFTDFEYCPNHAPSPGVLLRPYTWISYFGFPSPSQLRIGILCRMLGKFRWPF